MPNFRARREKRGKAYPRNSYAKKLIVVNMFDFFEI